MDNHIERVEDLEVYQLSLDLNAAVRQLTDLFPSTERYGLVVQMNKASASIPSNIAEGYGRYSTGDYIYHLKIALGECREIKTQTAVAVSKCYVVKTDDLVMLVLSLADRICAMLYRLIKSLERHR